MRQTSGNGATRKQSSQRISYGMAPHTTQGQVAVQRPAAWNAEQPAVPWQLRGSAGGMVFLPKRGGGGVGWGGDLPIQSCLGNWQQLATSSVAAATIHQEFVPLPTSPRTAVLHLQNCLAVPDRHATSPQKH